jgi:hypothetical protein
MHDLIEVLSEARNVFSETTLHTMTLQQLLKVASFNIQAHFTAA